MLRQHRLRSILTGLTGNFLQKSDLFLQSSRFAFYCAVIPHPHPNGCVHSGKISSADAWLDRKDLISLMNKTFDSCGEDMETASVAQLCHCFAVPLLSIRMLSNTRVHDEEYDESVTHTLQEYTLQVLDGILAEIQDF